MLALLRQEVAQVEVALRQQLGAHWAASLGEGDDIAIALLRLEEQLLALLVLHVSRHHSEAHRQRVLALGAVHGACLASGRFQGPAEQVDGAHLARDAADPADEPARLASADRYFERVGASRCLRRRPRLLCPAGGGIRMPELGRFDRPAVFNV